MLLAAIVLLAQTAAPMTEFGSSVASRVGIDEPQEIRNATVRGGVYLSKPWKREVTFESCRFEGLVRFNGFQESAHFGKTGFADDTQFRGENSDLNFASVQFEKNVRFRDVQFRKGTWFRDVQFGGTATFYRADFHDRTSFDRIGGQIIEFRNSIFHGPADFEEIEADSIMFENVVFNDRVWFSKDITNLTAENATFEFEPHLNEVRLLGRVSFAGSTFKKGLDLRFADFSQVDWVSLENIRVEPRELRLAWSSLSGKLNVDYVEKIAPERFPRLAASYEVVVNALKVQGHEDEAEEALHELERRRQEVFGGVSHNLYGLLLGYGYQPWRIIFLVIPLILFFAALFVRHRETVANIVNDDIKKGAIPQSAVSRTARLAQLLFFSTAVLLGIRFKQEWIQPANTPFVLLVTTEWVLGIALYVAFFALVKTTGFAYVKGLLGF